MNNFTDWSYTLSGEPELMAGRGFTGHSLPQLAGEWLPWFNLYNMPARMSHSGGNGRLYDPVVGRFLSPDPVIQDPLATQEYNRYSYCLNNPLKYTDPTGYKKAPKLEGFDWAYIDYMTRRFSSWGNGTGGGYHTYISSLGGGGYYGIPGANVTHGDAAIPGSYYGEIIDAIRNGFTITVTDDFSRINVNISIGKLNPVTSKEGGIYSFNPTASSFLIPTTGYFGVAGNIPAGQGVERDWLDKTQIGIESYALSNSSKEQLFKLAAKTDASINNLKYVKGVKVVGKTLVVGSVAVTGYQVYNDWNKGNYYSAGTRAAVLGIGLASAAIPVAGWFIAGGIGVADAIWGEQFYNWVELNLRNEP